MITSNVAILWDWQNVKATTEEQVQKLLNFAQQIGTISDKTVWAHWRKENPIWEEHFDDQNFNCQNAPASKKKKNNADRKLIEHGEKNILPDPDIKVVILLSADGDFAGLVRKLKQSGKKVIVIGQVLDKISHKLCKLADSVYTLGQI